MIVVQAQLLSATSSRRDRSLCEVHICNVSGGGSRRNYSVKLYSAGEHPRLVRTAKVENWPSEAKPAWRLIQAAMEALGE